MLISYGAVVFVLIKVIESAFLANIVIWLTPVLIGFVVAKLYPDKPFFVGLFSSVIFILLIIFINLIFNRGAGLIYIGGLVMLPVLLAVGGLIKRLSKNAL